MQLHAVQLSFVCPGAVADLIFSKTIHLTRTAWLLEGQASRHIQVRASQPGALSPGLSGPGLTSFGEAIICMAARLQLLRVFSMALAWDCCRADWLRSMQVAGKLDDAWKATAMLGVHISGGGALQSVVVASLLAWGSGPQSATIPLLKLGAQNEGS